MLTVYSPTVITELYEVNANANQTFPTDVLNIKRIQLAQGGFYCEDFIGNAMYTFFFRRQLLLLHEIKVAAQRVLTVVLNSACCYHGNHGCHQINQLWNLMDYNIKKTGAVFQVE